MVVRAFVLAVGAVVALALPTTTPARADASCDPGAAQPTCDVLDDCYVVGALRLSDSPQDAVAFYRTCLFTDHDYDLVPSASGSALVKARPRPLPQIYQSTFWPLYCTALERAGERDVSICERRTARSSSKRTHHRKRSHRRTRPQFTG